MILSTPEGRSRASNDALSVLAPIKSSLLAKIMRYILLVKSMLVNRIS